MLFETPYPNNQRTVSGTPTIYQDDVVLNCDTSTAPVNINLLEIPDNHWNTVYKLYIVDISANASVNNITINAGAGQTINGVASITVTQNNGAVIVRVANNNSYAGMFNYSTNPSPVDTGWLDLQGFSWVSAAIRPQYRVIGKQIVFRKSLVIPIEKGGVILPYTGSGSYESEPTVLPTSLAGGGVVLNSAGSVTFNNGASVLQNVSHNPDASYTSPVIIATQRRNAQAPVSGNYLALYHAPFQLVLSSAGILTAITLKNVEEGFSGQQIGQSTLRYLTSKSRVNQRILDYRNITDSAAGVATIVGRSNVGTPNDPINIGLNTDVAEHLINHDPAEETEVGGYTIPLMDFKAYN